MGSSYIDYHGSGFWSRDCYIEHALALLAEMIPEDTNEPWLAEARLHWLEQSSGIFMGWIHPRFDELLTTEDRRQVMLRVVEVVASREDATPELKATLRLLTSLVRGELRTDASSPLDYMVSGALPDGWPRNK